jgi:multidrug efflux pump
MDEKRLLILRDEKPFKAILSLAIPTILGMIIQIFYNLTDTFFVGKLNDPFQVAAVSISFPIFMMLMSVSGMFGFGASSYVSRLLGQKDYLMAKKTSATAFYACMFTGVVVTFLGLLFISPILHLIGVTQETLIHANQYLTVIFLGSVIIMTNFSLGMLLRSEGAAKIAMFGMFIGTGMNILLDPIFILVLGYGVKGAAIATVIGQLIALLFYLHFYVRRKSLISVHWKYFSPQKEIFLEIFRVGIPASLNSFMMSIAQTLGNYVAAGYNDLVVAAFGINDRLFSMAIMLLIGLSEGTQPLIGYSYGARKIKRLNQIIKTAELIATGISVFFLIIFYLFAGQMIQVFINNEEVIDYGVRIMRAFIIALPFAGIQFLIRVSFQALGKGKPALILALSRQGLFYIPLLFALNKFFGFSGFIYAQPISNVLTFILAILLFRRIKLRLDNEYEEEFNKATSPKLEESCSEA